MTSVLKEIRLALLVAFLSLVAGWKVGVFRVYEFGGDEGYEVYKAYLITKGYLLYRDIWNDQPPIHTYLLAGLFELVGPSIGVARCVSILSSGGTALCLWLISRRTVGRCAAAFVVLGFLAWPEVLMLSASAMLEMPMLFLTMLSVLFLDRNGSHQRIRILASASVFAVAVNVKLTALLFTPYLLLELRSPSSCEGQKRKGFLLSPGISEWFSRCAFFGAVFLGACGMVSLCFFEKEAWGAIFRSHFAPVFPEFRIQAGRYRFSWELFGPVWEVVGFAFVGLACAVGRARIAIYPALLNLAALILVHDLHQPFWQYYAIHFAVPICLIAGVGFDCSIRWVLRARCGGISVAKSISVTGALVGLLWAACITTLNVVELVREISSRPLISSVKLVEKIRLKCLPGEIIFTDQPIVSFYSGLIMPPSIAVLPAKRFWSKQISVPDVLLVLRSINPKRIAVFGPDFREALRASPPIGMQRDLGEINADYWIRKEAGE